MPNIARKRCLFLIAIPLVLSLGCGKSDQPAFSELYPVKGVVKRGGQPVKGGVVRFTLDPEKPEFQTNAIVGEDGTYSLTTFRTTDKSGERKSGAPAGTYKVTYVPDLADQTAGGAQDVISFAKPVTVVAGENDAVVIDLPAKKK
jgi:hypothetical protein